MSHPHAGRIRSVVRRVTRETSMSFTMKSRPFGGRAWRFAMIGPAIVTSSVSCSSHHQHIRPSPQALVPIIPWCPGVRVSLLNGPLGGVVDVLIEPPCEGVERQLPVGVK